MTMTFTVCFHTIINIAEDPNVVKVATTLCLLNYKVEFSTGGE